MRIPCMMIQLIIILKTLNLATGLQLITKSTIPRISPKQLHSFVATPTNWPRIVASSHSVKRVPSIGNDINRPLRVGERVEELFGLRPLFPLSVTWECVNSDPSKGVIEFFSSSGVPMIASECSMKFKISPTDKGGSNIELQMEFQPYNPIILLSVPFLNLDNDLALKVLLPNAIKSDQSQNYDADKS